MFALFCLSLIAAATSEHVVLGSACSVTAGEPAGVCSMAATSTLAATKAPVSTLEQEVAGCEPGLASVLLAISQSVVEIGEALRTADFDAAGTTNSFGDEQLQFDLLSDNIIFQHLRSCGAVSAASSEETTEIVSLGGKGYSVAFDPLDGSSIVAANFAVGSIFGIWPGDTPIGQTGAQQVAAAFSVYGPRTILVVARPATGGSNGGGTEVQEFVLSPERQWLLRKAHVHVGSKSNCAPANLRAAADNAAYKQLMDQWIQSKYKLRYSGGMVPDVYHIIAKGGGVFCNPASATAPAKLRLLYECAPLAFIMEAAGGASHDGNGSVLAQRIEDTAGRTIIALGSKEQVNVCIPALQGA